MLASKYAGAALYEPGWQPRMHDIEPAGVSWPSIGHLAHALMPALDKEPPNVPFEHVADEPVHAAASDN